MNNLNQLETQIKQISKEDRRKMLKEKLRKKIQDKKGNRETKSKKEERAKQHVATMKKNNINVEQYLDQMFQNGKQRKMNKKRIKKLFDETEI